MAERAFLEIRGAVAGYGDNTVLHGVDLSVPAASWTTLIGANGAGKTTLLKLIAGIVPCRSGEILTGRIKPPECEHFGTRCTPESPLGAPMVSAEGACAAYYRYAPGCDVAVAQRGGPA